MKHFLLGKQLLPPTASLKLIEQQGENLKLKATAGAASKDQPVTSMRLLMDGRPLPNKQGHVQFDQGQDRAEVEWSITLPAGEHQLVLLVRSADTAGVSEAIQVKHGKKAPLPVLRVLAIGISDYRDKALNLQFAVNDARALAKAFQDNNRGLFGEVDTTLLTDREATRKSILATLASMRVNSKANDLLVVFFSGHALKDKNAFYLLTAETDFGNLATTALSGADLHKGLGEFPCQVLLLLDACHSAAGVKAFKPATDDVARALTDDDVGVAVMSAAMAHEKAEEKAELKHGLFTAALIEGLSGKAPVHPRDGLVYLHHLHAYVFDRVTEWSEDRQHPFLSLPSIVQSFPIGKR